MKTLTRLVLLLALAATPALRAQYTSEPAKSAQTSQSTEGRQASTPEAQSPEADKGAADANDEYRHSPMVVKLGSMMGMNVERAATVFEVLNFAVLAVLVGWFLLKTLPKTFRARTTTIQKHLVDARTATEEASARMATIEDRLGHLDGQIAALRTQSENGLVAEEQRLKAAVEDEKAKILAAAEQEIAAATLHARRQLQIHAAELAIEGAARKLVISAETDRLLVQTFARRLGDSTRGGGN